HLLTAIEKRKVEIGIPRRVLRQATILHLADDADDRQPGGRGIEAAQFDPFADGALSRPEASRNILAHDDHTRVGMLFLLDERPAALDRDLQRREEIRRCAVHICAWL